MKLVEPVREKDFPKNFGLVQKQSSVSKSDHRVFSNTRIESNYLLFFLCSPAFSLAQTCHLNCIGELEA